MWCWLQFLGDDFPGVTSLILEKCTAGGLPRLWSLMVSLQFPSKAGLREAVFTP